MAILRRDDTVQTTQGQALSGASVYYLTQPANTTALTPLATVYSNTTGTVAANPQITDGYGHAVAYLANTQAYTVVYVHPLIGQIVYADQTLVGSVTNINQGQQVPTGTINGTNTVFTLAQSPVLLSLYRNGVFQTPGFDYSLAGNTITYVVAPLTGDNHYAIYSY